MSKSNHKQETLADIMAGMRYGTVPKHQTDHELLALYADRIEAAAKRELEAVGNAAAMYEALRTLRQRFNNNVMAYQDRYLKFSGWHWHKKAAEAARWRDVFYELREACDAALAAPPRNCDIYTTEDAVDTATVTVRDECGACPHLDMDAPCVFCMVRWLLAPAKESGVAK